jgi:CheY-like chemotaxis protein
VSALRPSPASPLRLLLADDDEASRALVAGRALASVATLEVLEANDGAEAIRLGLQQQPQIALLDVSMPWLGGIEAAVTLRELQPHMSVALHATDPHLHRERAHSYRLPIFDKLEPDGVVAWLRRRALARPAALLRRRLSCSRCGYGVARATVLPQRCPMCHAEGSWIPSRRR